MTQPQAQAPSAQDFLLGQGAKSASFLTPGTTHGGYLTKEPIVVQERDIKTKELKFWPNNGGPVWQLVVTIQTTERDPNRPNDDGKRSIYASSSKKAAIADAVRNAGAEGLAIGGYLEVTYTHDLPLEQGQLSAKKQYTARYAPPTYPVDGQNQAGPAQPNQAPPQQAQQYQPPVQQQPQFQQPQAQQYQPPVQQQFPPQAAPQPQFQAPQQQFPPQAQQGQFPPAQQAPPVQQQAQQFPPQGQAPQPQAQQGGDVAAAEQQALLNILQQAQQGQPPVQQG
jgi:hypothetical protein